MIHTTCTFLTPIHVRPAYASCRQSTYKANFHANPTELDRFTAPKKKCSRLHLSARLSGSWDPPQFLSQYSHWSSALKPSICWKQAISVYWSHKHQHAIGTFNICSWRPTHWSLIDTGEGYNLQGVSFPRTTLRHSQPAVFTFHLRVPPGLRLSIQQLQIELDREQTLNLTSGSLHSTSTVTCHLSIA
jgi:hypothetical protein